jgi:hypothetical protein
MIARFRDAACFEDEHHSRWCRRGVRLPEHTGFVQVPRASQFLRETRTDRIDVCTASYVDERENFHLRLLQVDQRITDADLGRPIRVMLALSVEHGPENATCPAASATTQRGVTERKPFAGGRRHGRRDVPRRPVGKAPGQSGTWGKDAPTSLAEE